MICFIIIKERSNKYFLSNVKLPDVIIFGISDHMLLQIHWPIHFQKRLFFLSCNNYWQWKCRQFVIIFWVLSVWRKESLKVVPFWKRAYRAVLWPLITIQNYNLMFFGFIKLVYLIIQKQNVHHELSNESKSVLNQNQSILKKLVKTNDKLWYFSYRCR